MVIGVTGYGATGASACIDLIKEYEGIQSYISSFEFQLLQQVDGILDLQYSLFDTGNRLHSNSSLKRFYSNVYHPRAYRINKATNGKYVELTKKYINNITDITWNGFSLYDSIDCYGSYYRLSTRSMNHALNKVLHQINKKLRWPPKSERYFSSLTPEQFNNATREYIHEILLASGFDPEQPILLEQLFNVKDPLKGCNFFDDVRSIIVDRDPRDLYYISNFLYRDFSEFMPNSGNVEVFVKYYKSIHYPRIEDPRVLYIHFEDLIYDYDACNERIRSFLGGFSHEKKGHFFKPECSINNTQFFKDHSELAADFQYIEKNLRDYLYPFEAKENNLPFVRKDIKPFIHQT